MMKLTPQMLPVQIDASAVDVSEAAGPPFELPQDGWSDDAQTRSASDDYQASTAEADRAGAEDSPSLDESLEARDERPSADEPRETRSRDDRAETRSQDGEDEIPLLMAVHDAEADRAAADDRPALDESSDARDELASADKRPVANSPDDRDHRDDRDDRNVHASADELRETNSRDHRDVHASADELRETNSRDHRDVHASADELRETNSRDDRAETRGQGRDDGNHERPLLMAVHAAENARDLSRRRLGQRALANALQRPVGEGAEGLARRSASAESRLQTAEAAGTRFAGPEGSEKASTEERVAGSKLEPVARKNQVDRTQPDRSQGRRTNNATADKIAQMRAVDRAARTHRGDIARDLLENVLESRMDEARAPDRVSRAAARGEGVRTAVTENVISEVHKIFKKASDKRAQVLEHAREQDATVRAGEGDENTEGEKAAAGKTPTSIVAGPISGAATVAPISGAATVSGQAIPQPQALDPAVAEALRNVRTEDPGDTVLKLRDTAVGQLEVRIRAAGDGLMVLVKAEETALRHKLVEGLSDLRSALNKAELVAGRVDVAEYGAFENETRGESGGQEFSQRSFEESLERHASEENDGRNAKPDNSTHDEDSTSRSPSSTTARAEDGRLHVIV